MEGDEDEQGKKRYKIADLPELAQDDDEETATHCQVIRYGMLSGIQRLVYYMREKQEKERDKSCFQSVNKDDDDG